MNWVLVSAIYLFLRLHEILSTFLLNMDNFDIVSPLIGSKRALIVGWLKSYVPETVEEFPCLAVF